MTKRIPAANAMIGFNLSLGGRVKDVVVLRDGRGKEWSRTGTPQAWRDSRMSEGACSTNWLNGEHENTPEWVFSSMMCFWGFADSGEAERAIAAFAKIEECAWARAMMPLVPPDKIQWRLA
ncbi:hypothetical protein [Pseudoroseomonas cervicalis]|uniref:hypothetical protein n=1 Tax=Teichococcus cervicalis TaxID=204525 RepID=UPI0027840765|nr:hypothetical protein [Pseudoroseomonas cervicalis]MDQ1081431.1 hypothetical protein [Pseudoroseomonas cervicalis]